MKATILHNFTGCFSGCPWCSGASMGPNYCRHPKIIGLPARARLIIGYSSASCHIPNGMKHPKWCPIAAYQETLGYRFLNWIAEKFIDDTQNHSE